MNRMESENILFDVNHNIKIADFGMAVKIEKNRKFKSTGGGTYNY